MAFKSKYSGAKVDELLDYVNKIKTNPQSILENLSESDILNKITAKGLINKINTVNGNITFKKYVDCQVGAGKSV